LIRQQAWHGQSAGNARTFRRRAIERKVTGQPGARCHRVSS
jgi:hypothetical protein